MFRSFLLALDDTPGAAAARDLCFAVARRTGARVTALSVLDRPGTSGAHEAVPLGGGAFAERRNRRRAEALEAEATANLDACGAAAAGLPFEARHSDAAPGPALLAEGAAHDLIIVGRDSTLGAEGCEDGLSPTIEALLRDGARPLLVVPPGPLPDPDAPVLIAYDGSMPAQRTVQLLALSGLAGLCEVTIPAGRVDGAPVGLSIVAAPGRDRALLDLAVRVAREIGLP